MYKYLSAVFMIMVFCFFRQNEVRPWHITGYAQGTTYNVTYYSEDSLLSKQELDNVLNGIDSSLSIYKPYSLISRFNNSNEGLEADRHLKFVVEKSFEVSRKTEGAFDITVFPLVQAWGFGTKPVSSLPDPDTIRAILNCVGWQKLSFNKNRLIKAMPCVKIDVNGIAQGYTVDVLADYLESKKIRNYLVELGGEIRVKGRKPGGQLFTVGIEAPAKNSFEDPVIQKVIELNDGAVTTSGSYRKYVKNGSKRLSHLIDPKTGNPIETDLISVTLVARDAITADAYDNSLMNMGLRKAMAFAEKHDFEAYFIYYDPDGAVRDTATAGFGKFIKK